MKKIISIFVCALLLQSNVRAESDIRLIVPFSAGGVFDIVARQYAKFVQTNYNQNVIVENVTGAGSIVGTKKLLTSNKKNTALFTSGSFYVNLVKNSFNEDQFTVASIIGEAPFALAVHKDSGHSCQSIYKGTKDLFIGHAGKDSGSAIPPSVMSKKYSNIVEVPFKGISQALLDLLARRIDIVFVGSVIHSRPELILLANTDTKTYKGIPGWNECIGIQQRITTQWIIATNSESDNELVKKLNEWAIRFVNNSETKKFFDENGIVATADNLNQTAKKHKELLNEWKKIYSE
jgi:tripartite-type tricarboxylate transporter receptor subunit TctC